MIDSIIEQFHKTTYDFRKTANPEDPLVHMFDDWVEYYKLKWAISFVLKPASILEVGVRFGYSAAAFLDANPAAHYVGIDLDVDTFGGTKGAINWAQKITQSFDTEFIIADTQLMNHFPGDVYDLIHVDGQQDGDGSFHDLQLAIKQSRCVLMDGFFWGHKNFMAASDFLFRHSDWFDWYGVIPGYAGELLIKVSEKYLRQFSQKPVNQEKSSLSIRQTYTAEYYTEDCGGFDAYKKNCGKQLDDPRLQSVAAISSLKSSGKVLDIGCGRGELSYFFAKNGFNVTSVDYSQSAIALAEKCFDGEENVKARVRFICDDVCQVNLSEKYDLAIASDVIEHLSYEEVDCLYQKVANSLHSAGLFVVHTFPNLWYYKYNYTRKRRIAASVGAYLSPEPRSRYELLMHINEQSPKVMKRQLSKHFQYVYLWFGDHVNPGGNLVKRFSMRELSAASSLFAVASDQPIDRELLKRRLDMLPLPSIPGGQISIFVENSPSLVKANSQFEVGLEIENRSEHILHSHGSYPVHIAYHWMNQHSNSCVVFDGERTRLPSSFGKGNGQARVRALPESGHYILRITLVQEGVRWFDEKPTLLMADIPVEIS